jgi:hypothetical protein
VIRVYDDAGNVIETHEHAGEFKVVRNKVRWFNLVREWWRTMSGWLSIPFALLALFNIPGRFLFAALAYASFWARVIAQARRISDLQRAVPSPNVTVRIGDDLIDLAHGSYWIRGEIENASEYRAESCRMKLLKVEGQSAQNPHAPMVENGPLQWQGGGCEPRSLDPHEKLDFVSDVQNRRGQARPVSVGR